MKLSREEKTALWASKGSPVEMDWTPSFDPTKGQTYAIEGFDPNVRLMVCWVSADRKRVTATFNKDPILTLPGLKGTRNENGDYEDEPEPVNARYQAILSAEGAQKTARLGMEQIDKERALEGRRKLQRAIEKGSKGEQRYYERVQRHKEARRAA